ncbi:hypothetical protein QOT17_014484 [Balamuthia mandrillaris]
MDPTCRSCCNYPCDCGQAIGVPFSDALCDQMGYERGSFRQSAGPKGFEIVGPSVLAQREQEALDAGVLDNLRGMQFLSSSAHDGGALFLYGHKEAVLLEPASSATSSVRKTSLPVAYGFGEPTASPDRRWLARTTRDQILVQQLTEEETEGEKKAALETVCSVAVPDATIVAWLHRQSSASSSSSSSTPALTPTGQIWCRAGEQLIEWSPLSSSLRIGYWPNDCPSLKGRSSDTDGWQLVAHSDREVGSGCILALFVKKAFNSRLVLCGIYHDDDQGQQKENRLRVEVLRKMDGGHYSDNIAALFTIPEASEERFVDLYLSVGTMLSFYHLSVADLLSTATTSKPSSPLPSISEIRADIKQFNLQSEFGRAGGFSSGLVDVWLAGQYSGSTDLDGTAKPKSFLQKLNEQPKPMEAPHTQWSGISALQGDGKLKMHALVEVGGKEEGEQKKRVLVASCLENWYSWAFHLFGIVHAEEGEDEKKTVITYMNTKGTGVQVGQRDVVWGEKKETREEVMRVWFSVDKKDVYKLEFHVKEMASEEGFIGHSMNQQEASEEGTVRGMLRPNEALKIS